MQQSCDFVGTPQLNLVTLATIGFVQLLAVMSPGPSFLITARTAEPHKIMPASGRVSAGECAPSALDVEHPAI